MKHDGKAGEQYMQRAERMRKLKMRWEAKWAYMVLKIGRSSDVTLCFVWGGSKDMGLVVFGGSEDVVVRSKGVVIIVGLGCVRRFGWVEWWCKPSIRCSMRMRDGGGVGTTWSRRLWMQKIKDKRRNYNSRMSCSHRCLKRKTIFNKGDISRCEYSFCIKIINSITSLTKRITDENVFGGVGRKLVTIMVNSVSKTQAAKNGRF